MQTDTTKSLILTGSLSGSMKLLDEAQYLISRSRVALSTADEAQTITTQTQKEPKGNKMTTEVTSTRAGELYAAGKSVAEVAAELSTTYAKARRLIKDSGTPVRDASARLKGRTRKIRS